MMLASIVEEALPVLPNGIYEVTGSDVVHAILMLFNSADNALAGTALGIFITWKYMTRRKGEKEG
jgi:hypothetical protein